MLQSWKRSYTRNSRKQIFFSFEKSLRLLFFQLAELPLKSCSSSKMSDTKSSWIFQEIRNHKGKLKKRALKNYRRRKFCQYFRLVVLIICLFIISLAISKKINGVKDDLENKILRIEKKLSASTYQIQNWY